MAACAGRIEDGTDLLDRGGNDRSGQGFANAGAASKPSSGAGGNGGAAGNDPSAGDPGMLQTFAPPPAAMRRLTTDQYIGSVRDLLGPVELHVELEADTAVNGFVTIGTALSTISPTAMEKYETAAYDLAQQALAPERRAAFVGCAPKATVDAACTRALVTRLGRKAFRRPLTTEEVERYAGVAENAANALGDFFGGLEFAVAGLLLSPDFLFRVELGAEDPANPLLVRYDSYELASRLSYLLRNTTPDDALLDAAQAGELNTPAGLNTQVAAMLNDPRVHDAMRTFHAERLGIDTTATPAKDTKLFPAMTDSLAAAMREDVLRALDELTFAQAGDFRRVFDTRVSFVDAELAAFYGVPAPKSGFARVELPVSGPRLGLLGKAALLTRNAHFKATSPTLRGKFVRERVLCQSISPPPANVVPVLPEPDPNAPTMRARLERHRTDMVCAGCHNLMDPIGLAFEHFDAIGQYREDDGGHALDVSGDLDGTAFAGPSELAALLAGSDLAAACVVRQLYRYVVAHVETDGEAKVVDALVQDYADDGYKLADLVRAITLSDGFRFAGRSQP